MLKIYVFGPTEEGFLDLDPGTVLQMESLFPAWDEDLSTGDFSLPTDFPWTDNNRRLLGYAERLENFNKKEKSWRCIVYDEHFPEFPNAKLTMLEKSGTFSYTRGKFSGSISGNKGLFGSLVKNKTLKNLRLGGPINYAGFESRQFATDVMHGVYPQYAYLKFAPIAIESFFDTSRLDYDGEFLAADRVNYMVVAGGDYSFKNPSGATRSAFRTVPFFSLKYVLRAIFLENGYEVVGDFIDDPEFDDLVIFNQFALENYAPSTGIDFNTLILPGNHVPDMLIKDWLAALFSFFNLYPDFGSGVNLVHLHYRQGILANRRILDINTICSNKFTGEGDDDSESNGWKIDYTWDSADGFVGDRVKSDIEKEKNLVGTVSTFADLATLDIGRIFTTDDIVFVVADNMYYQLADASTTPMKWDAYAERLTPYQKGEGDRNISVGLSPLCTYVEFDSDEGLYLKKDLVGCRQPGSYINNRGVRINNPFGFRIFYIKMLNRSGVTVPVSFTNNRDGVNNRLVRYSLAWGGEDGIAENFHAKWQEVLDKKEVIKTSLMANQKTITDLNLNDCVEKSNVLFLPYKIERTVPLGTDVEISLVPL